MQLLLPEFEALGVAYTGADISMTMIEYNRKRFSETEFVPFSWNIVDNVPPGVDAVIMRDVLFHMSPRDGLRALNMVSMSGAKYLFTTSFAIGDNNPANISMKSEDCNYAPDYFSTCLCNCVTCWPHVGAYCTC
jgi:hypothetical protein